MSDKWDELIDKFMFCCAQVATTQRVLSQKFAEKNRDEARSALRAEIAKVEQERDEANEDAERLAYTIEHEFEPHSTESLELHRARLAKGSEA